MLMRCRASNESSPYGYPFEYSKAEDINQELIFSSCDIGRKFFLICIIYPDHRKDKRRSNRDQYPLQASLATRPGTAVSGLYTLLFLPIIVMSAETARSCGSFMTYIGRNNLMDPNMLSTQEGMETVLRSFLERWPEEQVGRISERCHPRFVTCSYKEKTLRLGYFVEDWMRNYADIMHGGIVSTVFDLTMGLLSCFCSGGLLTPTVNMQVNFLRPIPSGETLLVEARCDMAGKTLCAASATAWLESNPGKLLATASATFYTGSGESAVSLFEGL
jgi:uncharacterized protein (TIGR00369 family)